MSPLPRAPRCRLAEGALERLPAREAHILRRRYVDWWTYREIGRELGLSIERCRQLVYRAERRLSIAVVYPELDFRRVLRQRRLPPVPDRFREYRIDARPPAMEFLPPRPAPPPPRSPRAPPYGSRRWESQNPPPSQAPLGTLDDVVDLLERLTPRRRQAVIEAALRRLARPDVRSDAK